MGQIADVLRSKGTTVHSISPEATVFEAISKMAELGIGSLLVVEGDHGVRGIITERDYLTKVALAGRSSRTTPVKEIMSIRVSSVAPGATFDECLALMTAGRHRHVPVIDGGRLVGLISVGDIVKYRLVEANVEIQDLTDYVTGKYPR